MANSNEQVAFEDLTGSVPTDGGVRQAELIELAKSNPYKFLTLFAKAHAEAGGYEEKTFDEEDEDSLDQFDIEYGVAEQFQYQGLSLREKLSIGGGEGGGEEVVRVYALVKDAVRGAPTRNQRKYDIQPDLEGGEELLYICIQGYYASYDGITWNEGAQLVTPKQVMVTRYVDAEGELVYEDGTEGDENGRSDA